MGSFIKNGRKRDKPKLNFILAWVISSVLRIRFVSVAVIGGAQSTEQGRAPEREIRGGSEQRGPEVMC